MFKQIHQTLIVRQLSALRSSTSSNAVFPSCRCTEVFSAPKRAYSYFNSKTEESPDKYTKYEKSFKEWKFVERLMPPTHVPTPPSELDVNLPSGWRPPNPPSDTTYLIRRTKNHLVPVYEKIEDRGLVRNTYIGKVEGNIWQLEMDIARYLQRTLNPKNPLIVRTNEISRHVIVQGSHVDVVKQWVIDQGY